MNTEIRYHFHTPQIANRFLNELKNWPVARVNARLINGAKAVKINYQFDGEGFDYTCAELDDLAAKHQGIEIGD